jgi:hypothetical protein
MKVYLSGELGIKVLYRQWGNFTFYVTLCFNRNIHGVNEKERAPKVPHRNGKLKSNLY